MPKAAVQTITTLHNLPLVALVDDLGALRAQLAALEAREKALRDELIRRGVGEAAGAHYRATVAQAVRWSLDTRLVRERMGSDWFDAHCRPATVTTVAVKAIASFPAAA